MLVGIVLAAALAVTAPSQPAQQGRPPVTQQQTEPQTNSRQRSQDAGNPGTAPTSPLYVKAACDHGCGYSESDKGWWNKLWTDPIASFTALLFISTILLWLANLATWWGAKKSSERQLRAYVSVRAVGVPIFSVGNIVRISLCVRNHGDVPASDIHSCYRIGIFPENPFDKGAGNSAESKADLVKFTVFPNDRGTLQFKSDWKLTQQDWNDVFARKMHIHVWGETSYLDGFGKVRTTKFDASTGGQNPGSYWNYGPNHNQAT